jgi:hypothetical protein
VFLSSWTATSDWLEGRAVDEVRGSVALVPVFVVVTFVVGAIATTDGEVFDVTDSLIDVVLSTDFVGMVVLADEEGLTDGAVGD